MVETCFYTIFDSILIVEPEYTIKFQVHTIFQMLLAFEVEKWRILGFFHFLLSNANSKALTLLYSFWKSKKNILSQDPCASNRAIRKS